MENVICLCGKRSSATFGVCLSCYAEQHVRAERRSFAPLADSYRRAPIVNDSDIIDSLIGGGFEWEPFEEVGNG